MAHPPFPEGELLRRAIRSISEQRTATPEVPLIKMIEEAGRQFDLSPKDCNFLVNFFSPPAE